MAPKHIVYQIIGAEGQSRGGLAVTHVRRDLLSSAVVGLAWLGAWRRVEGALANNWTWEAIQTPGGCPRGLSSDHQTWSRRSGRLQVYRAERFEFQ
jgi:hypothetical protein